MIKTLMVILATVAMIARVNAEFRGASYPIDDGRELTVETRAMRMMKKKMNMNMMKKMNMGKMKMKVDHIEIPDSLFSCCSFPWWLK